MPDLTKTLEDRLRSIEDRLEIYNLIASHPPSADTGAAHFTRSAFCEDGVIDPVVARPPQATKQSRNWRRRLVIKLRLPVDWLTLQAFLVSKLRETELWLRHTCKF